MYARPFSLSTAAALLAVSVHAIPSGTRPDSKDPISWGSCNSTLNSALRELAAAGTFECAVITVPLDYTNDKFPTTIELPLVKWPAASSSRGSVLINPGGPGGSGIELVITSGPRMLSPIHEDWDIIGFDPRGTGLTLPFDCDVNRTDDASGVHRRSEPFALNLTDLNILEEAVADGSELGDACYETQNTTAPYIGTTFAARDILSIVDAVNEDGLLRYWGISYGTVLGTTFASMFPDRVDRMLLDSNVDPDEYFDGSWLNTRADTPTSLDNFFNECLKNPNICPFTKAFGPDITVSALTTSLNDLYANLANDTTPVIGSRYMNLKTNIISLLYAPPAFAQLAEMLSLAFQGNYSYLDITPPSSPNEAPQAFVATACTDSTFRVNSANGLINVTQKHLTNPSLIGSGFEDAGIISAPFWQCPNWPFEPMERFIGPWGEKKTRAPILFANGLYDPGTPMMAAEKLHGIFEGSGLLRHAGAGHGVMNHPSNCTIAAIKAYFLDGTLPDSEIVCEPNLPPFQYGAEVAAEAAAAAAAREQEG